MAKTNDTKSLKNIKFKRAAKTQKLMERNREASAGFSPQGNVSFCKKSKLTGDEILNIARYNQKNK